MAADYTTITNLRGPAARIIGATAESVSADQPAEVIMSGPDQARAFHVKVPRGLDGETVMDNDSAMAQRLLATDTLTNAATIKAVEKTQGKGLSPLHPMFGAVGDGITDDGPALQAFLDYVANNDVGVANVGGRFATSIPLVYKHANSATESVKTLVFSGQCNIYGLAGTSGDYLLKMTNAIQQRWEFLRLIGPGLPADYGSRTWAVGLYADRISRSTFGTLVTNYFWYAGVWAGDNNNSLTNYGNMRAAGCGSGATEYANGRAKTAWSGETQTGTATSTSQTSTITCDTLPPASVMNGAYGAVGASVLLLRITLATGKKRLFYVKAINQGTKRVDVTPWIGNGDTAVAADWVWGGALVLRGGDSSVSTFDGLDASNCGIGLNAGSLYIPTAQRVVAQFCGVGVTVGNSVASATLGGKLSGVYVEGNDEDIIWVTRPGSSAAYSIFDSEYALNLAKCYVAGNMRDATGKEGSSYTSFGSRFAFQGKDYQPIKQGLGGSYTPSTRLIEINRPEQVDLQFSNGRTFSYSISNDVNRLTGYDAARLLVVGPGTNGAPTGTISFSVPAGVSPLGSPWTLNGGSATVSFTTFAGPAEFVVHFDFVTGNCRVLRLAGS